MTTPPTEELMDLSTMSDDELEEWRKFYVGKTSPEAVRFMRAYYREVSVPHGSKRVRRWLNENMAKNVMDVWESKDKPKFTSAPIKICHVPMTAEMREEAEKNVAQNIAEAWRQLNHPNGSCSCGTAMQWEKVAGGHRLRCPRCG